MQSPDEFGSLDPCPELSTSNHLHRVWNRLRGKPNVRPLGDIPSTIIDSQACEFGFEMFYHVPYANFLAQLGCLEKTVSCAGTRCFYWFSPNHEETYQQRRWVKRYESLNQKPHGRPEFWRWSPPNFHARYHAQIDFPFQKPLLLIFNKYNTEWNHPPINFLSVSFLQQIAKQFGDRFQIVYFRPTKNIVVDNMPLGELNEKDLLRDLGVVMVEDLYQDYSEISFNEFQLCLIAQSSLRISVQGGSAYMNAFFPGTLFILHRYGAEMVHGTYLDFERMGADRVAVYNDERALLSDVSVQAAEKKYVA
ncbi:hypothetical protein CA13_02320 [Planctomycetes bacterium CA13]|uniref:Capsular polysaccharide biosynthesis protein n=2 Tax=Novipirellula herctigrandis TaxID=2527986 RepID=A0A5C5YV32_9BACT|nr:hypothetical protein CA13_02320 [Planctomycetes bacterium CA13]